MSLFDKIFKRDNKKIVNAHDPIDENEMLCPNCKNPIGRDMRFCASCGSPLKEFHSDASVNKVSFNPPKTKIHRKFCTCCGTSFDENMLFCPSCGMRVITSDYTIEIEGANAKEVKDVLSHYEELNQAKLREAMSTKQEMNILGDNWSKKQAADILKELARYNPDNLQEPTNGRFIFISYAHRDSDKVFPMLTQFKEHGYRIWFDESIEPASTWDDNIAEHIEQATFFISLISRAYLESKNCLQELRYSLEKKNENNQFLIYIEPIELPKGIAMRTSGVQNLMLYSFETVEEFFARLKKAGGIDECIDTSMISVLNKKSDDEYAMVLQCSAESGNVDAQFELGRCYYDGIHVKQSYSQAVVWYKKAAEQGMAIAQHNVALCYESGIGTETNYKEAFRWYMEAALQNHSTAQNHLGLCFDTGIGTEIDHEKAVYWFKQAAENGHAGAQLNLGLSYQKGEGIDQDLELAKYWLQKSAGQGEKRAQRALLNIALLHGEETWIFDGNGQRIVSSDLEEPEAEGTIQVPKGKLS